MKCWKKFLVINWNYNTPLIVIALSFLTLIANNQYAQELRIKDKISFTPVQDVFIYDIRQINSTLTDSNGVAKLDAFKTTDTLVFQHPSFIKLKLTKEDVLKNSSTLFLEKLVLTIDEFVFSASKSAERKREVVYSIEQLGAKHISNTSAQTTADLIQSKGSVSIQKSQMGGGSPVIRGFEANRVLLVVDGVRINNAIYRSGHLQNSITIDNGMLDKAEIIFGPSSVMYGSDALGGVMHFYTKNPTLSTEAKPLYRANAFARYSSANQENTGHVDVSIGKKKFGWLMSITGSKFGDLMMGSVRPEKYPDFGKVTKYVAQVNGRDSMLLNPNFNLQRSTGYRQLDIAQKLVYKPSDSLEFSLNLQYSTSSNIARFDRLNDTLDNGNLKYAKWYYGPQNRLFTALVSRFKSQSLLFNQGTITVGFQAVEESRHTRRYQSTKRTDRNEQVIIGSVNCDFVKSLNKKHKFVYGLEFIHNEVYSNASITDIKTGAIDPTYTRYPDGGSFMQTWAGYLHYKLNLGKKAVINIGGRYSVVRLRSQFEESFLYTLPYDEIRITRGAPTGTAGVVYNPTDNWQFRAVFSSGFRAPNVDDYGKIFEKNGQVIVPNDNLKPEYAYNGEVGVYRTFFKRALKLSSSFFYTYLVNAIVQRNYQLDNTDSLLYDGQMAQIQASTNTNEASIWGVSTSMHINISDRFYLNGTFNYTNGFDITDSVPLAHIPPVFGKIEALFKFNSFTASIYSYYNGWKPVKDYHPPNLSGTDNLHEATQDGTPAWATLNLMIRYQLTRQFNVQLGVHNILDTHYKPFASGISAPGRNFSITFRANI